MPQRKIKESSSISVNQHTPAVFKQSVFRKTALILVILGCLIYCSPSINKGQAATLSSSKAGKGTDLSLTGTDPIVSYGAVTANLQSGSGGNSAVELSPIPRTAKLGFRLNRKLIPADGRTPAYVEWPTNTTPKDNDDALLSIGVAVPPTPGNPSPGSTSSPGPTLSSSSVTLSWSASSGATTYGLGVRDIATGVLVVDTNVSGTSFTANLSDGKQYRWNVDACNSAGCSSFTTVLFFQTPAVVSPLSITTTTLPGGTVGTGYGQGVTASGGQTPYSWSVSSGLPPGLSINATVGSIFGTPTTAGTFSFTVTVRDSSNPQKTASKTLSITIVATTPPTPTNPSPGSTSSPGPTLSSSSVTLSWSASSGATTYGLGVRDIASGVLVVDTNVSGTSFTANLSAGKQYRWNVDACNSAGCSSFTTVLFFQTPAPVSPLSITTTTLPGGTVGTGYGQGVTATGGQTPYSWSVSSGLPPGLSINATVGSIFGTPTTAGTFSFTVTVKDNSSPQQTASRTLSITITTTIPATPTNPSPGSTSSPGPTLSSSSVTLSWSASSGATTYGLGVRDIASGVLVIDTNVSGTAFTANLSAGKQYRWNVDACNSAGCSNFTTVLFFQTPSTTVIPGTPGNPSPGFTTSPGPTLSSSSVTLSWGASSGATTYGLGVRDIATGVLVVDTNVSGTSFTANLGAGKQYRWNVDACNSAGCSSFTTVLFFQTPAQTSGLSITTTTLPQGAVGTGYGQGVTATGGQTPYSWSVSSGLPPGLAINATVGSIFGTPTAAGTFSFTVTVRDSSNPQQTASRTLSITIVAATPATPANPTPGSVNSPGPTVASNSVTLSWSASSGATSYGLGVRDVATGALVVDTTVTGTSFTANLSAGKQYRWNVDACNGAGCSSFTTVLFFQTPLSTTAPATPSNPSPGLTSSPGPTLSSGSVTLSWSASSGATAYGLGVRDVATGVLVVDTSVSGTSYTANLSPGKQYRWNVDACNSAGCSSFTTVLFFQTPAANSALSITTTTLPGGTVGTGYGQGVTATGGQTPYSWSVSNGLPPGLAINATVGSIFGTPTTVGTFSFTVTASDSSNPQKTASRTLSITITSATLAITNINPITPILSPSDQTIHVTGDGFQAGLSVIATFPNGGKGTLNPPGQVKNITSTSFDLVITLGASGVWTIQAVNPNNTANPSAPFPFTVISPPSGAVTLSEPVSSCSSITLNWTVTNDSSFVSYDLYRAVAPGVSTSSTLIKTISSSSTTQFVDSNVQANTTYYYRVFVHRSSGTLVPSGEVSGRLASSGVPVISSSPNTSATVGQQYLYSVIATDPHGSPLTFSLTSSPQGMSINGQTGVISWVPGSTQSGQQSVTVKVSNGCNQATQTFTITVGAGNTCTQTKTIGSMVIKADCIIQTGPNSIKASGHVSINDFLRFDGDISANISGITAQVSGSGAIFMDGVAGVVTARITLLQGQFSFTMDGGAAINFAAVTLANTVLQIGGLPLKISSFTLLSDGVRISGSLIVPPILGAAVTVNDVEITRSHGVKFSGSLKIAKISLPGGFKLSNALLTFDTINRKFSGTATLDTKLLSVTPNISIEMGCLDSAGVKIETSGPGLPIFDTGLAITGGEVNLENICSGPFSVELGLQIATIDPLINQYVKLDHVSVKYTIPDTLDGEVDLKLFGSDAATIHITIEGLREMQLRGNLDLFKVINGALSLTIVPGSIKGSINGDVTIPAFTPNNAIEKFILSRLPLPIKLSQVSGSFADNVLKAQASADGITITITMTFGNGFPKIGLGANFTGHFLGLFSAEIQSQSNLIALRKLGLLSNDSDGTGENRLFLPDSTSINIPVPLGTSQILFSLTGQSGVPSITLTSPDGSIIAPETIDPNIIYSTDGASTAFFFIKNPAIGVWAMTTQDAGTVLDVLGSSGAPSISFTTQQAAAGKEGRAGSNGSETQANQVTIQWDASAPAGNAQISFFYDKNNSGATGTKIIGDLTPSAASQPVIWDTSGIASGEYYIYAMIDDGANAPVIVYNPGKILIDNPSSPAQPRNFVAQALKNAAALGWTGNTEADLSGYVVHYTSNLASTIYDNHVPVDNVKSFILQNLSPQTQYRIAITAQNQGGNSSRFSDPQFVVTSDGTSPVVQITSPRGGEKVTSGQSVTIQWTAVADVTISSQQILLSLDGGLSYPIILASGLSGSTQSFVWNVPPDLIQPSLRVRVVAVDIAGNIGSGVSDAVFSSAALPPLVVSLTPSQATAANSDLTINIVGSNFYVGSVVLANSQRLQTTFVNDSQLNAVLPAGIAQVPQTLLVSVQNADGQLSSFANLKINPHSGNGHPALDDFDADGKTDFGVWRASTGTWYVVNSGSGQAVQQQWGSQVLGDKPVPGDYDGDGKTDFAVWRPATGTWYVINSSDGQTRQQQWGSGALGDIPVPGDYDGDGKTDFAVWRASTGTWFVIRSSTGQSVQQQWGSLALGDIPVPGDYDGDGKTDFAVWRASTGTWFILNSSNGQVQTQQWGSQSLGDVPVPGDYDGDGKTDFAVWRASTGTWFVRKSATGQSIQQQWGSSSLGDIPVAGDYDGDGQTDFAVWRPGTGIWFVIKTSDGSSFQRQWGSGALGDVPAPGR